MKISVVITNWNGLKIIKRSLPEIFQNTPQAGEFIFADDASTDDSVKFVKSLQSQEPRLKIIVQPTNKGFSNTSNLAVKKSGGDLVVLLNNDIFPTMGYLNKAIPHFKKPNIFGVGFAEIGHENWARIYWKSGYLQHEPGLDVAKAHTTAWLSGGSSIVRRHDFLRLNGFDEIYSPFYSEDLDLGYRAWKSGYQLAWEPQCRVYHRHGTTTSHFPRHFLNYVQERNRLLSVWRNINDPQLLRSNRIALIGRVLFGPNYLKIIRAAGRQINRFPPPCVFPKLSDQQIFQIFKD